MGNNNQYLEILNLIEDYISKLSDINFKIKRSENIHQQLVEFYNSNDRETVFQMLTRNPATYSQAIQIWMQAEKEKIDPLEYLKKLKLTETMNTINTLKKEGLKVLVDIRSNAPDAIKNLDLMIEELIKIRAKAEEFNIPNRTRQGRKAVANQADMEQVMQAFNDAKSLSNQINLLEQHRNVLVLLESSKDANYFIIMLHNKLRECSKLREHFLATSLTNDKKAEDQIYNLKKMSEFTKTIIECDPKLKTNSEIKDKYHEFEEAVKNLDELHKDELMRKPTNPQRRM